MQIRRWIWGIIGILSIGGPILIYSYKGEIEQLALHALEDYFVESNKANLHISYADLRVDMLTQKAWISDLCIYSKNQNEDIGESIIFHSAQLHISGIDILKLYKAKVLNMGSIEAWNASLDFNMESPQTTSSTSVNAQLDKIKLLEANVKVRNGKDSYALKNANIELSDFNCLINPISKENEISTSNMDIQSDKLNIRSNVHRIDFDEIAFTAKNTSTTPQIKFHDIELDWDKLEVRKKSTTLLTSKIGKCSMKELIDFDIANSQASIAIKDFNIKPNDKIKSITIANCELNTINRTLSINDFKLTPKMKLVQQAEYKKDRSDWTKLSIAKLALKEISVEALFHSKIVKASNGHIYGPHLTIKKYLKYPSNKHRKHPQLAGLIRSIPIKTDIRTVTVADGFVQYEELKPGMKKSGMINFQNIEGTMKNLSNTSKPKDFSSDLNANIMGQGRINLKLNSGLQSNSSAYNLKANVTHLPLTSLNFILTPLLGAKIRNGNIDEFDLAFTSDKNSYIGQGTLRYNDLQADIINKKTGKKKKLISFLANNLMLQKRNPKPNEKPKSITINLNTNTNKSIFNHWWRASKEVIIRTIAPEYIMKLKDDFL